MIHNGKMLPAVSKNKIGSFSVSREFLFSGAFSNILSKMIIVRANWEGMWDAIDYTAFFDEFISVPHGVIPFHYVFHFYRADLQSPPNIVMERSMHLPETYPFSLNYIGDNWEENMKLLTDKLKENGSVYSVL